MKSIIIYLTLLISFCAIGQNKALFINQKQDNISALLFSEIDSITYSYFDLDSIEYTVPVTQEIWTPDTIYRISLCDIDSVCFQTPPTVLKPHSINLTLNPIRQYVISASQDDSEVILSNSTPSNLIPKKGDFLVAMEYGDVFGYGFIGEVKSVDSSAQGIVLSCDEAELTDVFDCYYGVFESVGYNQDDNENSVESVLRKNNRNIFLKQEASSSSFIHTFHIPPLRFEIPTTSLDIKQLTEIETIFDEIKGFSSVEYPKNIEGGFQFELAPVVTVGNIFIVRSNQFYQRATFVQTDKLSIESSIVGEIGKNLDLKISTSQIKAPIPLLKFFEIELGLNLGVNASLGLQHYYETNTYRSFIVERNNQNVLGKGICKNVIRDHQNYTDLIMNGSVSAEVYITPILKFFHKNFLSLQGKFYAGIKLYGDFMYNLAQYNSCEQNAMLYNSLEGKGWGLEPYGGFELTGQAMLLSRKLCEYPFNLGDPFIKGLTVPNVENTTVEQNEEGKTKVDIKVNGNCVTPHRIGIRVVRNEGLVDENVHEWIEEQAPYWTSKDGLTYTHDFDFPINKEKDKVYPLVEYYGKMIVATPSWPVNFRKNYLFPYITYMSKSGNRIMSGAQAIKDFKNDEFVVQEGNFLPFTYFPEP